MKCFSAYLNLGVDKRELVLKTTKAGPLKGALTGNEESEMATDSSRTRMSRRKATRLKVANKPSDAETV